MELTEWNKRMKYDEKLGRFWIYKKKRMKFVCPQFRKAKAPSTISLAYQQRQVHIAEIH